VTLADLLWYLPLAVAISLVMGAASRRLLGDILRASLRTFATLVLVVAAVGAAIRMVVVFFV
jgi:hypothetical protein